MSGRLPTDRPAITHKFSIGGTSFYLTVGLYEDGTPGELFIKPSKSGSNAYGGLASVLGITASMALQRGVPLGDLCRKWEHTRYEPLGVTSNKAIPMASSITDYIAKFLRMQFGEKETK